MIVRRAIASTASTNTTAPEVAIAIVAPELRPLLLPVLMSPLVLPPGPLPMPPVPLPPAVARDHAN